MEPKGKVLQGTAAALADPFFHAEVLPVIADLEPHPLLHSAVPHVPLKLSSGCTAVARLGKRVPAPNCAERILQVQGEVEVTRASCHLRLDLPDEPRGARVVAQGILPRANMSGNCLCLRPCSCAGRKFEQHLLEDNGPCFAFAFVAGDARHAEPWSPNGFRERPPRPSVRPPRQSLQGVRGAHAGSNVRVELPTGPAVRKAAGAHHMVADVLVTDGREAPAARWWLRIELSARAVSRGEESSHLVARGLVWWEEPAARQDALGPPEVPRICGHRGALKHPWVMSTPMLMLVTHRDCPVLLPPVAPLLLIVYGFLNKRRPVPGLG